ERRELAQELGQVTVLPQQAQMGRVTDQEDQVKVRVAEDLVGDVVPVGAAGKGDGRAEAHRQSLRRRFLILYHFDVTRPQCSLTALAWHRLRMGLRASGWAPPGAAPPPLAPPAPR